MFLCIRQSFSEVSILKMIKTLHWSGLAGLKELIPFAYLVEALLKTALKDRINMTWGPALPETIWAESETAWQDFSGPLRHAQSREDHRPREPAAFLGAASGMWNVGLRSCLWSEEEDPVGDTGEVGVGPRKSQWMMKGIGGTTEQKEKCTSPLMSV